MRERGRERERKGERRKQNKIEICLRGALKSIKFHINQRYNVHLPDCFKLVFFYFLSPGWWWTRGGICGTVGWAAGTGCRKIWREKRLHSWNKKTTLSLRSIMNIYILYRVFIKYCVFSKNSRKFAISLLASTRLLLVVQKRPANRSDCTLALRWELWRSLTAMLAREGLQLIVEEHNFSWTPCRKCVQTDRNIK